LNTQQINPNSEKTPWTPGAVGCAAVAGLLALIVVASVSWWLAYPYLYPVYAARYELRLDVDTPQGVKTGSSVMEARYGWQPTLGGITSSVKNGFSGEAVFVDLGDGKNLVVTLTDDRSKRKESIDALYLPMRVFPFTPHDKALTKTDIENARSKGPVNVPLERLPLVITFSNIADPKSVKRVDPSKLEASFGVGYHIASATVEMTEKPLRATITKELPWLVGLQISDLLESGTNTGSTYPTLGYGSLKSAVFSSLIKGVK
jgi:hypothetical protein